jgi:hypothetical protein
MTTLYDLGDDFSLYKQCYNMSMSSVKHFMPEFDKHVLVEGIGNDPYNMLRDTYYAIMSEVKNGNNVFYMEIDCLMVKPVSGIFDFQKFELFARTSPYSIKYGQLRFDPYMNSGVKYIPATLPRDLIAKADEMISQYDKSFWGYDQVVYNMIYHDQHERAIMREHLNYMPLDDVITHIKKEDAAILHFCSSRGVKECRDIMETYYMGFHVK